MGNDLQSHCTTSLLCSAVSRSTKHLVQSQARCSELRVLRDSLFQTCCVRRQHRGVCRCALGERRSVDGDVQFALVAGEDAHPTALLRGDPGRDRRRDGTRDSQLHRQGPQAPAAQAHCFCLGQKHGLMKVSRALQGQSWFFPLKVHNPLVGDSYQEACWCSDSLLLLYI